MDNVRINQTSFFHVPAATELYYFLLHWHREAWINIDKASNRFEKFSYDVSLNLTISHLSQMQRAKSQSCIQTWESLMQLTFWRSICSENKVMRQCQDFAAFHSLIIELFSVLTVSPSAPLNTPPPLSGITTVAMLTYNYHTGGTERRNACL